MQGRPAELVDVVDVGSVLNETTIETAFDYNFFQGVVQDCGESAGHSARRGH